MSLFSCNLDDLDVVVVHYLQVRPTVAMLNALFKVYPEIGITLVDNSGGVCVATEQVLPRLGDKASQIRVLVNPATEHGHKAGPLSHGAGLDLAFLHSSKPYILSLETDTFILERGPLEFALSLLQNDGYDWAGLGQKPINGLFASFSPSFAIFKTALVRDNGLSFKVKTLNQGKIDPDHPLLQHHRQAANRVRLGLPLLYPDGKAPDTYRLAKERIELRELGHLEYFDTAEWVHHRLLELGYRGQLFIAPPGVCHSWGSRDEDLFFLNLQERLPELNVNLLLPPELQLKTHSGELPTACLALLTPNGTAPATHWAVQAATGPVALTAQDGCLCIDADLAVDGKAYVSLSEKTFDRPAPEALGAAIVSDVHYQLLASVTVSGTLQSDIWVIEYGAGKRLNQYIKKIDSTNRDVTVNFRAHSNADQFRVLFRLAGQGTLKVSRLELIDHYRPKPSVTVASRLSGYMPKKHACIVVCADALRADYEDLVATYHAGSEIGALQSLKSMAQAPDVAYTAATWTLPSHMSMFTGLYPHQHGYGVDFRVGQGYPLPQHLAYLPQYLVGRGIPCYGFHNGGVMEPSRGLGYGWTRYSGSHPGDVDGPVHSFMKALPELGDTFFAFIHTYAVHNYYSESATPLCLDLLSPFERKHLNTLLARWGNLRWLMAENLRAGQVADALTTEIVRKLYVGATLRFDRLLNQLVQRLQATGSFDQCTLLLLSDHGEALGEVHEGVQHWSHMTINVHEENIRVPFLFKPGHGVQVDVPKTLSLVDLPNIVTSCFGLPSAFPRRRMNEVFVTGATHQFGKEWETTIPLEQRIYRSALLKGGRKHHLLGDAFYLEKTCNVTSQPFQDERLFGNFEADITLLDIERLTRPIPMDRLDLSTPIAPEFLEHLKGLGYVD